MSMLPNKSSLANALSHFNPSELETYLTLYDENVVLHFLPQGLPQGITGARLFYGAFFAGFPDANIQINEMVEEGDRVACLYILNATHAGEFNGIPASGKSVRVIGISVLRFADGKCVERWIETDFMGLLQQIGAIPTPQAG